MAITYYAEERFFKLDTPNTSYELGIIGKRIFSTHLLWQTHKESQIILSHGNSSTGL